MALNDGNCVIFYLKPFYLYERKEKAYICFVLRRIYYL